MRREGSLPSPRALVANAGDEKQVQRAGKVERQRLDQSASDLETVLATPAGQRFVWELLGRCNLYQSSFRGESSHDTAFQEGRRDLGLWLMARIERVRPQLFLEMMQARAAMVADAAPSTPTQPDEERSDA